MKRALSVEHTGARLLLVLGLLVPLVCGIQPDRAEATPAPAVITAYTTSAVYLSDVAGSLVPVETVELPAGAWTVSSDLTAINFGAGDFVRCQLQANGVLIDGGSTEFLADRVSGLNDVGTITAAVAEKVSVLCDHDHAAAAHDQFYVDAGATMTAVEGGPIKSPGHAPGATPTVVQGRSEAATNLNNDESLPVVSIHIPRGKWAVTADATVVNFDAQDFTGCTIYSSSGSSDGAVTGSDGTDAAAVDIDVESAFNAPSGGLTLELMCGDQGASNSYVDAGATLTASKVPGAVLVPDIGGAELPDTGGVSAPVESVTVPAGAWRVRAADEFGYGSDTLGLMPARDFVRCALQANGKPISPGATTYITPDVHTADLIDTGTFVASASWTLTLSCSHDNTTTGDDHWLSLGGTMTAVEEGPIN